MLRTENDIEWRDAEINRLKTEFQKAKEWNQLVEIQLKNLASLIDDQARLLLRAAETLDCYNLDHLQDDLIAELRKATQ